MHCDRLSPELLRREALARAHEVLGQLQLPAGTALAATGSLARGELTPYSDLDLILLHRDGDEPDLADFWYPIWDSPLHLDAAVRTPADCAQLVKEDVRSGLALLDIAHLAGDAELTATTREQVLHRWRRLVVTDIDAVNETAVQRWHRSGSLVTMTRPDLKNGRGGLRDVALVRALGLGNVADVPDLATEEQLLIDVRTLLHARSRRARDVLEVEFAVDIADDLGFADRHELIAAVVEAGRNIDESLTVALASAKSLARRSQRSSVRSVPVPLALDVVDKRGEVHLTRDPNLADPGLLVRVAAVAARHGLPISESTLLRLKRSPPVPERMPSRIARDFLALLSSPAHTPRVVGELDRAGLFTRLVPEWGHVRGRMPKEPSHVHSIDVHLLDTVARCAAVRTRVARPDLLLLAALYHDLGKGYGRPHEMVGAEFVARMSARLGMNTSDRSRVQTLVAEHTTPARLIARMDPGGDEARDLLLDACHYDLLTVELLGVHAECDARSTGPGVYSRSVAHGLATLMGRAREALTALPPSRPLVYAPAEIGVRRSSAGLTVFWHGAEARGINRVLALLRVKAWAVESLRLVQSPGGGAVAEIDVRPLTEHFDEAADNRALVMAYRSNKQWTMPQPEPGASNLHWHSGRLLEVRSVDRAGVIGAVLNAAPPVAWVRARTPGGTTIVTVAFAADVDRTEVERNVTSALGSR